MKKALSGNKSLSKEEEQELIRKYKEEGDEKAKEKSQSLLYWKI
jgi:hypothetical protein